MKEKLIVLFLRGFGAGIIFFNSVLITRTLGTTGSGYYYLALNIISITSVMANLGYGTLILKIASGFIEKEPIFVKKVFYTAFNRIFLGSLFFCGLVNFFADNLSGFLNKPELSNVLHIFSASIFFMAQSNLLNSYLQGCGKLNLMVFLQNISVPLFLSIFLLLATVLGCNVNYLYGAGIYTWVCFITFVVGVFYATKQIPTVNVKNYNISADKRMAGNVDYLLINLSTIIIMQGVTFFSSKYLAIEDIALLNAAQRITNFISFFYVSVLVIYMPAFSRLFFSEKLDELKVIAKKTTRIISFFGVFVILIIVFLSKDIMSIYGEAFIDGWVYLVILAIGQVINVLTCVSTNLLTMCGYQRNLKYIFLFSVCVSVISAIVIPHFYSTIGAAFVLALSLSFQNILSFFMVKKKMNFYAI